MWRLSKQRYHINFSTATFSPVLNVALPFEKVRVDVDDNFDGLHDVSLRIIRKIIEKQQSNKKPL